MILSPHHIRCAPGKVLVEITEQLGRRRGALYRPIQDHMGKDTAFGQILQIGPPPYLFHTRLGAVQPASQPWPAGYPGLRPGDIVVFPRDVPLAFTWEDRRYALLQIEEILFQSSDEEFEVQVVRSA